MVVKNTIETLLDIQESNRPNYTEPKLDSMIMLSQGYTIFMTSEGVIQDIIGSGNLNLISDDKLSVQIASWYAELKMIRAREELANILYSD